MRFVHIVFEQPVANGSGAQIRSHALNRSLDSLGDVLTVVVSARFGLDWHVRRSRDYIVAELPAPVLAKIAAETEAYKPDLVLVEGVFLGQAIEHLAARGHHLVLDAHNVESRLQRATDIARKGLLARLTYAGRWRRAANAERRICGVASAVWACSQDDAKGLIALAKIGNPTVIPNPVPAWCEDVSLIERGYGIDALFVGHLGYRPNLRAVERLALGIWPKLRALHPQARLSVAGRAPGMAMKRILDQQEIALLADPTELAPLYAQATMVLVPLTEGGGTRIKVLEAVACGVPVIASAKAVEGLDFVPGLHFLRAETDGDFVEAATRLSRDGKLRLVLQKAAWDHVVQTHGREAIERSIANAVHLAVKEPNV